MIPKILLCDDNDVDIFLAKKALNENKVKCELRIAKDGEEALIALEKEKPDIMLLDINMPKLNGLEVLKKIRENKDYDDVTVIILTTSSQHEELLKAKNYQADSYMVKDPDGQFTPQISTLNGIYFENHFKYVNYKRNENKNILN